MTSVVRPRARRSSACATWRSLSASSELVASSSSRIGPVGEQRPRDRNALALAARELDAALAEVGVEALRAALDELERVRRRARRPHLVVGRVRAAEAHVLRHARRENHRVLRHQRDRAAHVSGSQWRMSAPSMSTRPDAGS